MTPGALRPHIFVSFKSEERESAARLKDALVAAGYAVWWSEDIQCGHEWHGDIDRALATAGCVVVLWSSASMPSPWVRHEASQAIARGVYAPVRVEPIEIESPYNRIQATDLLGWNGEKTHAGWQNLVARVEELLPAPVPLARRARAFAKRHLFTFGALGFAVVAFTLLIQLSRTLGDQVTRQEDIANDIQRTLQPIQGLEVRATVELGPEIPGVSEYVEALGKELATNAAIYRAADNGLVSPLRTLRDGTVEALAITAPMDFWPPGPGWKTLDNIVGHVEMRLAFRHDGVAPSPDAPPVATADGRVLDSDLSFNVGAHDPDGSESPRGNSRELEWEPKGKRLMTRFVDVPSPKSWTSTNRIVAVPDLEASVLTIGIKSVMYPSFDPQVRDAMLANRRHVRLTTLFLAYSGRQLMIRAEDTRARQDADGLWTYSIDLRDRTRARRN